jgi:hypothetical protein
MIPINLEKNPIHRKVIIPWYDSNAMCMTVCVILVLTVAFGILGIITAAEDTEYAGFVWIPIALIAMSAGVLLSMGVRLVRRYFESIWR